MALYTDTVMDHFLHPRNVGEIADAVRVCDLADIARVHEMIHDGFGIPCHDKALLTA